MDSRSAVKESIRRVPIVGPALVGASRFVRRRQFNGSRTYWEERYTKGGTSGDGSTGPLASFKAEMLNEFVDRIGVESVVEFGCGDGQQLSLARYPKYLGLDVSAATLRQTMAKFAGDPAKSFMLYDPSLFRDSASLFTVDMAMSLDVIYHLVEDQVYDLHLQHVFGAARRFVVLYTSDLDTLTDTEPTPPHVKHRPVTRDVADRFPGWQLRDRIENRYPYQKDQPGTSFADFFIYERVGGNTGPADQ